MKLLEYVTEQFGEGSKLFRKVAGDPGDHARFYIYSKKYNQVIFIVAGGFYRDFNCNRSLRSNLLAGVVVQVTSNEDVPEELALPLVGIIDRVVTTLKNQTPGTEYIRFFQECVLRASI